MSEVQCQWSLDQVSHSVYAVARGTLRAATSDNVQPLAILACERFGNTIAMSQETCRKMETSVVPTTKPAVVHFLRGTVGYSANDCATQLGTSLAGVQFLGLASALVSTLGPFKGGNALEVMLKSSAADRTLLPTARQLKDLLASLEHRCLRSGFADSVIGWRTFMFQFIRERENHQDWAIGAAHCPSSEGLQDLVDAFRQLSRIGPSTVVKVTVKAYSCAPWVVAFTKWCLGMPPSIYLADGTPILEQPDAKIAVIEWNEPCAFEIKINHSVEGLATLLVSSPEQQWVGGMVSIEHYGQWLLQRYGLDAGDAYRALEQALPHAIYQVVTKLKFSEYLVYNHLKEHNSDVELDQSGRKIDESLLCHTLNPFQENRVISKMLSRMLGSKSLPEIGALDDRIRIADLPVVKLHLESLERSCPCPQCATSRGVAMAEPRYKSCSKDRFFMNTAFVITDILTLSLFHSPESLLVQVIHNRPGNQKLKDAILSIIKTGAPSDCAISSVFNWVYSLLGHDIKDDPTVPRCLMSCYKGQAFYPTLFDVYDIEKRGYLALTWLPGLLRYNGETYSRVVQPIGFITGPDPVTGVCEENVSHACNLVPDLQLGWQVNIGDGVLAASFTIRDQSEEYSFHLAADPAAIFPNLASALMVEACPHEAESPLDEYDRFCAYTGPIKPLPNTDRIGHICTIGVVAVDGADDLRLYSLSSCPQKTPIVMRKKACLQCCLDVCRQTNFPVLIL